MAGARLGGRSARDFLIFSGGTVRHLAFGGDTAEPSCAVLLRALFMNGTVGVGKTTVGAAVAEALADTGQSVAFVDLDGLSEFWPAPVDDKFNTRLAAKNLASVAENFAEAGAGSVVVAGVIESAVELALYEEALAAPLTVVRLVARLGEVENRLHRRHAGFDGEGLRWHLNRAPELDAILAGSSVRMTPVACTGSPAEVARDVLDAVGWEPPPERSRRA